MEKVFFVLVVRDSTCLAAFVLMLRSLSVVVGLSRK
jgi:hypothetical protein